MEHRERELIEMGLQSNFELRKLYEQHRDLEEQLHKLARRQFLTASEEQEEHKLKHLKLRGVERMLQMVESSESAAR
ncbi:MAG: DUF465 domain-containing protein [Proteobacteria bacterium]|jgi:hypothetical protein|nr:DUF465 domain-containing protein [Pseudomonadota bacterium]